MSGRNDKISFTRLSDHFNTAARAGVSYAAYLGLQIQAGVPADDMLQNLAIIATIFSALRFRYVREIPLLLTNFVAIPLMARERSAAPESVQSITDEFARKAGYDYKIKTFIYKKGITNNAFSAGDRFYIGKDLTDSLNREELRFVLGHELAHSRTQDMSLHYLFWPPLVHGFFALANGIMMVLGGQGGFLPAVLGYAYFKCQDALSGTHSQKLELRADRNALRLAENPAAARSALQKLYEMNAGATGRSTASKNWFSSHPSLKERLENIDREYALMTAPPAGEPIP